MQDTQLYEQLLGLPAPWKVEAVALKPTEREIEVRVRCQETMWACQQCCQRCTSMWEERRWRHLDSCQFKTIIVSEVPRLACADHGTQTVAVPWADRFARFSRLFERLAIDVMKACSVTAACDLLGISWDEADGIKQRAVARGLERKQAQPIPRLGVDEKCAGRGQDYVTVVARLDPGSPATVEFVGDGRNQEALDAFWQQMPAEHLPQVEAIAMDMWEPYFNSTMAHVPAAEDKIVFDAFHLARMLGDAVDKVRRSEHRALSAAGDDSLAQTKYVWLYSVDRMPEAHLEKFQQLRVARLQTGRAWAIKETFRDFWACETEAEGRLAFARWYGWAIRGRLER